MNDLELTTEAIVESATKCGDHPCTFPDKKEWMRIIAAKIWCSCRMEEGTCGSYCDTYGCAIVECKDALFYVVDESSDTTGHGCQCSGGVESFKTLKEAIMMGVPEDYRKQMKLSELHSNAE